METTEGGDSSMSDYYPEGISAHHLCMMEGCIGKGHCPRCGDINYHLLGYWGAVATWAKRWKISQEEAEKRIEEHQNNQVAEGL